MQRIMRQRRVDLQQSTRQDHLGAAVSLLNQYVELNEQKARQQIAYHVNQWLRENARSEAGGEGAHPAPSSDSDVPPIAQSLEGLPLQSIVSPEAITDAINRPGFTVADVPLLRDANTFRRILGWINTPVRDDPLLKDWFASLRKNIRAADESPEHSGSPEQSDSSEKGDVAGQARAEEGNAEFSLSRAEIDRLQTAARLFDWTVRNIALESEQLSAPPQIQLPAMPTGIEFEGPGYRQSDYQTVWRGRGDWLQRCGVFTQLCKQAGIPTAVLATQSDQTGRRTPWSVGVLIGEQIFLFEPRLGLPIPGPNQTGIATLSQAREKDIIMRRLNVAGYFDYPLSRSDIQHSVALLNLRAETLSSRMRLLESGLTGDRRMTLWVDAEDWAEKFDAVAGIAGARIWAMATLAQRYAQFMEIIAERDPLFAAWYRSRFMILAADGTGENNLAQGRWKHLAGEFVDNEMDGWLGARTSYLDQRAPEYEIEDLRINVELQQRYGLRRELGTDSQQFDIQLQRVQMVLLRAKRTATYWLALLQYDDGRFETAHNWFTKRVLDDSQRSFWEDAAVYNAARSSEAMGDIETAIETLKTNDNVSDHGNRLRARLLDKHLAADATG